MRQASGRSRLSSTEALRVLNWLRELPVGMPLCRALGEGLWEVRSDLPGNRIARMLFCLKENRLLMLHGFIKKTRTTSAAALALAHKRKREFGS